MIRPTAQLSIQHALTLIKKHKYDKAIKILQKILNQASDPEKLLPLAGEFFAQKSPLYALKFAEKIRQKFPDHAPTIAFCGSMLFELREYLQAKAVMEYAFQLDSNHPACQKIYVKYYSQLEKLNPQSIQNNIDKALKIDSSPDIYNLAGVSTEATGNIPQAIQYFKQGLRILIDSKVCPPPRYCRQENSHSSPKTRYFASPSNFY